jgi:hypothetical protein
LFDKVRQRINAGDREGARRELVRALRADPQNVAAWELLATVLDDPPKQADCYRQILRVDPRHSQAAASLAALMGQAATPAAPEGQSLRCQQCGGAMDMRFVGEMRDKRAVCPFCGHQVDVPDTYQRVERRHDHESRPWGSHTVDTLLVETRTDHGAAGQPVTDFPEIDDLRRRFREEGLEALNDDVVQELKDAGFTVSASVTTDVQAQSLSGEEGRAGSLLARLGLAGATGGLESATSSSAPLKPEDVVRLAGGPLPETERTECPKCGAAIPRSATRCDWCGFSLGQTSSD